MKRAYPDLATWRDRKGFTQREAARHFGVSQGKWSKLETGKLVARGKLLERLVVETGVPLETLVGIAS